MEIGGSDIYFENVNVDENLIISVIRKYWPNMVLDVWKKENQTDMFIYSSIEAEEKWTKLGLTDDNDTDLIYVILHGKNVTFVIDSDKKNKYIIDEIEKLIKDEDYWFAHIAKRTRQQWMKENP